MAMVTEIEPGPEAARRPWGARIAVAVLLLVAIVTVAVSNRLLTARYTEITRNGAEIRLEMMTGHLLAALSYARAMPVVLSRDQELIRALRTEDHRLTSQRLMEYRDEWEVESMTLLDSTGRVVADTERTRVGQNLRFSPLFVDALRAPGTAFVQSGRGSLNPTFHWVQKVEEGRRTLGVIVVEADLRTLPERRWARNADAVMVVSSQGEIILSTEPLWRGLTVEEAIEAFSPPSAIERALQAAGPLAPMAENYLGDEGVIRAENVMPHQAWKMVTFTNYSGVRERVNAVLALQITVFAVLLALTFYLSSRKASLRVRLFQRESRELRALNDRLSREIAERERAQADLSAAEATLEQSSKLAVLGEMSASVSHELNQPLAAMKTYLAGARLLLQRRRQDEALSSFQRIDDLIERMGAITRQLKSYARKGGEAFEPVDVRAAVSSALTLMEPQLRQEKVQLSQALPDTPVMALCDRLRLEQVIINLVRNALDAMKGEPERELDILLTSGEEVVLAVRDSGHGLQEPEKLFEPFYTTKKPGEGVGLGLAISSGIVTDLGGRLTARNAGRGGAVFEVRLPAIDMALDAAE